MLNLKSQLKTHLAHRGISAAQLARISGVPKQTISYWLGGGAPRKLEQLRKVAETLNTTIDELCFGDETAVNKQPKSAEPLDLLFGEEWVSGFFEIKLRRIK